MGQSSQPYKNQSNQADNTDKESKQQDQQLHDSKQNQSHAPKGGVQGEKNLQQQQQSGNNNQVGRNSNKYRQRQAGEASKNQDA